MQILIVGKSNLSQQGKGTYMKQNITQQQKLITDMYNPTTMDEFQMHRIK